MYTYCFYNRYTMPSVSGNLKANALTLQGHGALGSDLKMNVTDDNFVMSMGSNVLMTVAPEEAGVLNSGGVTDSVISLHKSVAVQGDLSATGAVSAASATVTGDVSAASISANHTISAAGPIRDGVASFLPNTRAQVQAFADNIISPSNYGAYTPNYFIGYGNAKDADVNVVVTGKQSNGSAVPSNPYFRMASTSKMIGAIAAGKLMAEGWINMDTPVAAFLGNGWYDASGVAHGDMILDSCGNIPVDGNGQYIKPWLSKNRTIIDSSGVIRTLQQAWAIWCAAQSPPISTSATLNPCPDITVAHCLNHTTGLSYDYYTFGKYSDLDTYDGDLTTLQRVKKFGYSDYLTIYATGQVGSSFADASDNYNSHVTPTLLVDSSGRTTYTSDNYLTLMSTQPISSIPGLYSEYGRGYDLLGFFIDQVIKQTPALSALYTNAIDYVQKTFLIPIGINDSWVMGGQSPAPADCETNMLSGTVCRPATSAVSTPCYDYGLTDTAHSGLTDINGVPVAKYSYTDSLGNTHVGYFDASNNDLTVFMDAVPGETNTIGFNQLYYQKTVDTRLKHVGQMGSAWAMSVGSYCKLLRLVANKGYDVVSNTRILPKSVFTFAYQSSVTSNSCTGVSDTTHFNSNAPIELTYSYGAPFVWSFGSYKFVELSSLPYSSPSFPSATGAYSSLPLNIPPLYPFAPGAHSWAGIYTTGWYMDPESGNYCIMGINQPGWAGKMPSVFQCNRSHIRAVPPGPSGAGYLGAKPVKSSNEVAFALSRLVTILDGETA